MKPKATSQDVADLAGVSRSAVSLVLNGRGQGNISASNQAAILAAAKALDYSPNPVALSLRTRRSSTIGLVTDSIATAAFAGRLIQGASERAAHHGYLLLVIDTQNERASEETAFEALRNRQVDGLIYAAMSLKSYDPVPGMAGSAVTLANCFDPAGQVSSFIPDEMAGSRAATRHLIERGHRDILLLTGTPDVMASGLREQGFAQELAAAGLPTRLPVPAGWEIDKGYMTAMRVLTGEDRPTGVVVANDRAAIGVYLAAAQLGLTVPGDLSVVGYDDDENVARWLVPALTTVRLPHKEIGEAAMQHLLTVIGTPAESPAPRIDRVLLGCPLIIRDSVAPPVR